MSNQELLEKVESIKNMLVSRATGGVADEHAYRSLRTELIRNPKTKDNIPLFVRTCRTLDEFWGFIQPKFAHYQERRIFIRVNRGRWGC